MNSISKLWRKLRNKEYRDGYTEAQLSIEVPFQIRALRKARGWTQAQLAERCGIPQAQISHIEQPGRNPLSLRTLYRLASAFDVGLLVQFVSFSELVHYEEAFDPNTFHVPSFKEDQLETVSTSATLLSPQSESTFKVWKPGLADRPPEMEAWPIQVSGINTESSLFFADDNPLDRERTKYAYETQSTGVH